MRFLSLRDLRTMKKLILLPLLFTVGLASAQIAKDIIVGGQFDIIKTDNDKFLDKAQFGAEMNYFFTRHITGTAGFDFWTGDDASFILGGRWYPVEDAFIRARGLIGENDLSIGAGWTKPLNEKWKFEAIGDFYFEGEFAIRVGAVYVIRRD